MMDWLLSEMTLRRVHTLEEVDQFGIWLLFWHSLSQCGSASFCILCLVWDPVVCLVSRRSIPQLESLRKSTHRSFSFWLSVLLLQISSKLLWSNRRITKRWHSHNRNRFVWCTSSSSSFRLNTLDIILSKRPLIVDKILRSRPFIIVNL